jgi:hypothetical protein
MSHKFVILKDGVLEEYDTFESIPETFDNVIKFSPHIPEGPHTEDQHLQIERWNDKLQELMKREKNASSN